jgi:hypothetical protein
MSKWLLLQHVKLLIYIIFFVFIWGGLSSGIFPKHLEGLKG